MKELYIILGMHRSGTSLTAQLLSKMNVWMGEESQMLSRDQYNEKGYLELQELVQIDDFLLAGAGCMWYSQNKPVLDKELTGLLVSDFARNYLQNHDGKIAMKEPRLTIMWREWVEGIRHTERAIAGVVAVRNPLEVAESLCKRDGMQQEYALCLWYRYNWECLLFAKEYPSVWVDYNEYFHNLEGVCDKIGKFIGVDWRTESAVINDVVERKIRHYNQAEQEGISWIEKAAVALYKSLTRLSEGVAGIDEVIEAHGKDYQTVYEYGLGLIYHESVEEAARRTYLYRGMQLLEKHQLVSLIDAVIEQPHSIVLCGNGKNLERLLPLLEKNDKNVVAIYDKMNKTEREYRNKKIQVCSLQEVVENDSEERFYLVTPFYQNEREICADLSKVIGDERIRRLSDILLAKYKSER